MTQELKHMTVARFLALPPIERSVVILNDVLQHSLDDIAMIVGASVGAVKAHLRRGRMRLKIADARGTRPTDSASGLPRPSGDVVRYAELFNRRDWHGLRALLSANVILIQPRSLPGEMSIEMDSFFEYYATAAFCRARPARLEGHEVVVVHMSPDQHRPSHIMQIAWSKGRIAAIRDYRYTTYVFDDAEFELP